MSERLLFLTGHLALPRLERMVASFGEAARDWRIHDIGVKVAALMTQEIIGRRLPRPVQADRVILPGRCRADLTALSTDFGVAFERGPEEIADLPAYLGRGGAAPDLSRYDMRIFAEIVDASKMSVADILLKSRELVANGADVIDLGCLPDTPFAHLEETIATMKAAGLKVSVDSADVGELKRAAKAGVDHLLSLDEETLSILPDGSPIVPVLTPRPHGDLDSLQRAARRARERGIGAILDPILDPIHFGFAASIARYVELRAREPDAEIMMGTGNLTELTDADSAGVTAAMLGICSELDIRHLLTVQVSPHTRRTLQEHDAARRLMFAARADRALPKGYSDALLQIHDRKPYAATPEEIAELARELRDTNFRIETTRDGVHIYAKGFHHVAADAMALFPHLAVEHDGAHAFYLGAELTKAELAYRLGKRYRQDEPLDFGVATDINQEDATRFKEMGHTMRKAGEGPAKDASDT
ncbi:MAG: dihydropteroate synthase [Alphaproteobacteria bacterium]|nr:dihydropteroate synthase [Alphaproteobacteria bacterium]MBM3653497.1 dihydropteroate synthase [Alphaproteobacteria bacterium]